MPVYNEYKAVRCPCSHQACKDWHVSGVANVQGVHFTEGQAIFVAEMLNFRIAQGFDPDRR